MCLAHQVYGDLDEIVVADMRQRLSEGTIAHSSGVNTRVPLSLSVYLILFEGCAPVAALKERGGRIGRTGCAYQAPVRKENLSPCYLLRWAVCGHDAGYAGEGQQAGGPGDRGW